MEANSRAVDCSPPAACAFLTDEAGLICDKREPLKAKLSASVLKKQSQVCNLNLSGVNINATVWSSRNKRQKIL